jgi:uncharacterized OB-fold protein
MGADAEFSAFLDEGRFMLQRSRATGHYVFYPRAIFPGTGETDLEWVEASGKGVVYSTTIVRNKPPVADYNVALVDLAEGPRMMTRIVDVEPDQVHIGMAVVAQVSTIDDAPAVVFAPVQGTRA